jgi:RNA polymerase sigma factor (sigma-70 family)
MRPFLPTAIQRLREAFEPALDAELLDRYVSDNDQSAFELLLRRHLPLILGVCRRILRDQHEAEDAVQATCMVLARKAASISKRESLGSWLHKVACRTALRLRTTSAQPVLPHAEASRVSESPTPLEAAVQREAAMILDEEINGLPEKYRLPLILHDLHGQPCREVARELDWPLGTLATRLGKARQMLLERLTLRGVALPSGLTLALLLNGGKAEAAAGFAETTMRAALSMNGKARVIALAKGTLRTMNPARYNLVAGLLLAILLGGGSLRLLESSAADEKPAPATTPKPKPVRRGSDWPMFGGTPARNMVNITDRNVPDTFNVAAGKNIKWQARLGSRSLGGPVVAGGRVFVGTNNVNPRDPQIKGDRGVLMCFEEATGNFLWQAVHTKLESGGINDMPEAGITSTPAVDGDRVYYVSNRATVVCATTAGKEGKADIVWEYDMIKQLNVFPHEKSVPSPLIVGDLLFVVTANGVDETHIRIPSPDAPSFLALNKKTGKVIWKDNSPGKNILHTQWSSPTLARIDGRQQILFPGGDGWLRAFEPKTGKLLWKYDCNPKNAVAKHRNEFLAVPVVHEGKVYIGTGQDPEHGQGPGWLHCIDPTRPAKIPADGDISAELVVNEKVVPPQTKPNPNSGQLWAQGGQGGIGRTLSTCAVHDGLVYAAELNGYLYCFDAGTGKVCWRHDLRSAIWGSPLWVDGKVYLGTDDGELWIFQHGKQKPAPVMINLDEPIRSASVVANGVLYVMTDKTLIAIAPK